jgi:uncharacterized protein with von Willebrand factor type A (vWA) domain
MNAIIPGSISAIAQQEGKSISETFMSAEVIAIIDVSGSMDQRDSRGGKSRYDVACSELASLQKSLPGKIAVMAFSNSTKFCPGGVPIFEGGGTDLAGALRFAKVADMEGVRFIVVSDGQPDGPQEALQVAKTYKNKIDVIYIGPEDHPEGRKFLEQLARTSGGQAVTADRAKELSATISRLLLKA